MRARAAASDFRFGHESGLISRLAWTLPFPGGDAARAKERQLATGIVKWFSDQKGYGFITPDEGPGDLFVHYSNILGDGFKTLKDGQRVEYDPQPGRKGLEAKEVTPA
jgi:CspA family cold shock protein